MVDNRKMKS